MDQKRLEKAFELGLVTPDEARRFGWMGPVIDVPKRRPTIEEVRQNSVALVALNYLDLHRAKRGPTVIGLSDVLKLMREYGMDNPEHWWKYRDAGDCPFIQVLLDGLELELRARAQ